MSLLAGRFKVAKKISDNAYILDLASEKYVMHASFNIYELSPYVGELQDENPKKDEMIQY